jgi:transcriptional regulator with XRE-family HTH domain
MTVERPPEDSDLVEAATDPTPDLTFEQFTELTAEQRFGLLARLRRQALGLSQAAVAQTLAEYGHSWHQTTVGKTEDAKRPIRLEEAVDLCAIYGLRLSDLVDDPVPEGPQAEHLHELMRREKHATYMVLQLDGDLADVERRLNDLFDRQTHIRTRRADFEAQRRAAATEREVLLRHGG